MKIKGFFVGEKSFIKRWIYISFVIFIIGITLGAVYCVCLNANEDSSLNDYFIRYFNSIRGENGKIVILKKSLIGYTRIACVIYLCSFVRPGVAGSLATVVLKGFTVGFTNASLIKYFGIKAILIPMASFISVVLYLPALLTMCAGAVNCSLNRYRGEKKQLRAFSVLAICCFTIFCAASVSDAFISTIFMKLIAPIFTK